MSLTFKSAQVRGQFNIIQASYTNEDGGLHRLSFCPLDDVAGEDQAIQDLASEYHTQEVKDSFSANLSKFDSN